MGRFHVIHRLHRLTQAFRPRYLAGVNAVIARDGPRSAKAGSWTTVGGHW